MNYKKNFYNFLHVFKFEYGQKPLFFRENPAITSFAGFSLKKLKGNSIFEGKSGTGRAVSGIHKIEAISGSLKYLSLNNRSLDYSLLLMGKKQGKNKLKSVTSILHFTLKLFWSFCTIPAKTVLF